MATSMRCNRRWLGPTASNRVGKMKRWYSTRHWAAKRLTAISAMPRINLNGAKRYARSAQARPAALAGRGQADRHARFWNVHCLRG